MKTIFLDFPFKKEDVHPCVIALGNFDGIHLAHKKLIQITNNIARKKGLNSAVMTFNPHPKEIILDKKTDQLMPFSIKRQKIKELGVDTLYVIRFNKLVSNLSPKLFVKEFLIKLKAQHVVVGFDYRYGFKAGGNKNTLLSDGDYKFELTVIPELKSKGEKIGSTQIRQLIKEGSVSQVLCYLGNYYNTKMFVQEQCSNYLKVIPFNNYQIPSKGSYLVNVTTKHNNYSGVAYKKTCDNELYIKIKDFNERVSNVVDVYWINKVVNEKKLPLVTN